ncbi:MAG: UDP-3-O-(3-hydroxymyristoyl)glucosamine N-acyltransferase [Bacteriovoracia bacterium]
MAFTVADVLQWTKGRLVNGDVIGARAQSIRVEKPSMLVGSGERDVAFFFSRDYEKEVVMAAPGVLIIGEPFARPLEQAKLPFWSHTAVIACLDPYWAMAVCTEKLVAANPEQPAVAREAQASGRTFVHPLATVDASATIGEGSWVGPGCVIEAGVSLGARCVLRAHVFLGEHSRVGDDCALFPHVTIYSHSQIGARVRVHAGAVIGADGFGYAPKIEQGKPVGHQKIHHSGRAVLGDDVEIGANACVDRGTFGDTILEKHVKLDNHVQVAHNAHVGEGAVICGSTALAGNSSVGPYAYIGGLTGVINKVHVGAGAKVAALSLISKDVEPGAVMAGNPQRDHRLHFKAHAALNKLVGDRKSKRKES